MATTTFTRPAVMVVLVSQVLENIGAVPSCALCLYHANAVRTVRIFVCSLLRWHRNRPRSFYLALKNWLSSGIHSLKPALLVGASASQWPRPRWSALLSTRRFIIGYPPGQKLRQKVGSTATQARLVKLFACTSRLDWRVDIITSAHPFFLLFLLGKK